MWTLRTVTSSGIALYAPKGVCECPTFVMATLSELAEHGIQSAELAEAVAKHGPFPMPVGPKPQAPAAEWRVKLAALIGDAKPARDGLLTSFGESIRDRREHDHTAQREDWFCMNLSAYMGERMAPVLLRLLDAEARVAELEAELATANGTLDDVAEARRAPRVLTPAEYGRIWDVVPHRTDRERIATMLAGFGLLTPPPPSEPGTCPAWYWDGSGWWQCAESPYHDPGEGHGNGEGLSWPDGVEYTECCPCPPEPLPAPHQVGCFFDGVPVSPPSAPAGGPSPLFPTVASLREVSSREEPHDSPLHRDWRLGHDLPSSGGAS